MTGDAAAIEVLLECLLEAEFTRHPVGPLAESIAALPRQQRDFGSVLQPQ